jgi:hypothetical protein
MIRERAKTEPIFATIEYLEEFSAISNNFLYQEPTAVIDAGKWLTKYHGWEGESIEVCAPVHSGINSTSAKVCGVRAIRF